MSLLDADMNYQKTGFQILDNYLYIQINLLFNASQESTADALNEQMQTQKSTIAKFQAADDKKHKKQAVEFFTIKVQSTTFVSEDIISMIPIVKDSLFDSNVIPRL
ncbi:hypothetical protein DAMA08_026450 [Martiniozyma asiatica (nom. inval.)]|nr:hypothetical protein DAMA08_026450 [Martiniozyma asiatica]